MNRRTFLETVGAAALALPNLASAAATVRAFSAKAASR